MSQHEQNLCSKCDILLHITRLCVLVRGYGLASTEHHFLCDVKVVAILVEA